jgi:hypothetical protein
MSSLLAERLRRSPPQSQEECVAITVRQCLAAYGPATRGWQMRGYCHGLVKGLFGEAWDRADKAEKLRWYRMAVEQYQIVIGERL